MKRAAGLLVFLLSGRNIRAPCILKNAKNQGRNPPICVDKLMEKAIIIGNE